jgi:hypothetical protein
VELPTQCRNTRFLDPPCYSDVPTDEAFVWDAENGMLPLDSLIDPEDPLYGAVDLTSAHDINDLGFIAANGYVAEQTGQHAFLLVPTTAFADGFERGDTGAWSISSP